jgi:dephospho-CoA kinase
MGAGKSTALAAASALGAETLSSDEVVHELYAHDLELRRQLVAHFGDELVAGDGIDRDVLAERIFARPGEREWLEQLIWPLVHSRIVGWCQQHLAQNPPPKALVVEVPLLFESGMTTEFDATVAVIASEPVRQERAATRGHRAADDRAARQLSQDEKAARATYVVHNDGSPAELQRQLAAIFAELAIA